jgi:hypothetical protein
MHFPLKNCKLLTWPITAKTNVNPTKRLVAPKVTGIVYFKTLPMKSRALHGIAIYYDNNHLLVMTSNGRVYSQVTIHGWIIVVLRLLMGKDTKIENL